MEQDKSRIMGAGLTRTGRRSGCSCCSFALMGLVALPVTAVAALALLFLGM